MSVRVARKAVGGTLPRAPGWARRIGLLVAATSFATGFACGTEQGPRSGNGRADGGGAIGATSGPPKDGGGMEGGPAGSGAGAGTPVQAGAGANDSTGGSAGGSAGPGGRGSGGDGSTGGSAGPGGRGAGGTPVGRGGDGAAGRGGDGAAGSPAGTGGSTGAAGSPASCGASCSTASSHACSSPEVRITEIDVGAAVQNNTDEAYLLPLAVAPLPAGGSRIAWMSGSTNYGSSSTSLVHVAELDCEDQVVGTPFTLPAHDFQDLAADGNGGVVVLTRDAEGSGDQHCGDVNHLCVLPSDRPGCYDMYMVRYDCSGKEEWATKLTSSNATYPPYSTTANANYNYSIWWYQHHGRLAYDGTNYAAYFCDAITVKNDTCVDIHQGDRMAIVGPTGSLVSGKGSFDLGCSHSGFTRILWDAAAAKFVMVCKTDNSDRIAQPPNYKTVLPITLDNSYVGDLVKAQGDGYWLTVSNGGAVHLLHFSGNSQADQDKTLATANYPHLVAYGTGRMIAAWATSVSGNMTAQVFDTAGGQVSSQFAIAVPGNPYQSFKAFPDGSAAYAAPGTSANKIRIARVLPCGG